MRLFRTFIVNVFWDGEDGESWTVLIHHLKCMFSCTTLWNTFDICYLFYSNSVSG